MITADDYLNYALEEISREKELQILEVLKKSYTARDFVEGLRLLIEDYKGDKGKLYRELKMNPNTIMKF